MNKFITLIRKNYIFLGIALAIALFDLWSKAEIFRFLGSRLEEEGMDILPIFPGFNVVMVWNRGVSFGMFSQFDNAKYFLIFATIILSIIVIVWMMRVDSKLQKVALSFVLGGAIGNITDRVLNGAVADFLDFYIGRYHWPAFNVADSFITTGVILLILRDLVQLIQSHKKNKQKKVGNA